jgi:hypothetical protein
VSVADRCGVGDCEEGEIEDLDIVVSDPSVFEVVGESLLAIAPGESEIEVTIQRTSGSRYTKSITWHAAPIDHVVLASFDVRDSLLYAVRGDTISSRYYAVDQEGRELDGRLPSFVLEPSQYQPAGNELEIDVPETVGEQILVQSDHTPTFQVEAIDRSSVTLEGLDDSPLRSGTRRELTAVSVYEGQIVPGWPQYPSATARYCTVDLEPSAEGYDRYLAAHEPGTCTLRVTVAYNLFEEFSITITP